MILSIYPKYKIECLFNDSIDDFLKFKKDIEKLLIVKSKYLKIFQKNMSLIFEYLSENFCCNDLIFDNLYYEMKKRNYDNFKKILLKKDFSPCEILEI